MKNVNTSVKLSRLLKSAFVSLFILFIGISGSAFISSDTDGDPKKIIPDSSKTDKSGFKSLFNSPRFDPSKPYVVQLNPRAITFVQNYIRTEGAHLERMKMWGRPYFEIFDGILTQHGLPNELKYLSVIESSLISNVVSRAGAVGPWQIMDYEAKRVGLRITKRVDERTDFYKSTHAAAKILKGLYTQFNDWTLVIAAYNCGAGRLRKAIKRSGSRNFWDLQAYLPLETRNHVKRFIGTHYVFEGSGGLTTMTASEVMDYDQKPVIAPANADQVADGTSIVEITGRYKSSVLAKSLGIETAAFKKLNPNFDKMIATGSSYKMRLPEDKMLVFQENKKVILYDCVQAFLNNQ